MLSTKHATVYYESRKEIESVYERLNKENYHVAVYHLQENGELFDYTDHFKGTIPKHEEEPKKSFLERLIHLIR